MTDPKSERTAGPAGARVQLLDTAGLPESKRFRAFQDFAGILGPDYRAVHPDQFQCTIGIAPVGNIFAFDVSVPGNGSDFRAHIDTQMTRRVGERICIQICEQGSIGIEQQGVMKVAGVADAIFSPCYVNGDNFYSGNTRFTAWTVERDQLASLLGSAPPNYGGVISKDNAGLRLLQAWARVTKDIEGDPDPLLAYTYEKVTLDLVAVMFGAHGARLAEIEGTTGKTARTQAILHAIRQQAGVHDLSPLAIARQIGITDRYMRKLLEETGRTFSEHLLEARLQRAHALLVNPFFATRPAGEIALEAGFSDISYFNKSFRRKYGDTPLGVRRARLERK